MSHTLFRGTVSSQNRMTDIAPRRSIWGMEFMHSLVAPLAGVSLKSDSLSSIGPRAMGKGFGPSFAHFRTMYPTLSTTCCWLQWWEICLAICRQVRMERSRAHCFSRGRSSGLSECWIFPSAFALLGICLWREDCPCVSIFLRL